MLSYLVGANTKCELGWFDHRRRTRGRKWTKISPSSSSATTRGVTTTADHASHTALSKTTFLFKLALSTQRGTAKMITADLFQEPTEAKNFFLGSHQFHKRRIQMNWKRFEKEEGNKNLQCSFVQLTLLRTLLWFEIHRENNFWANILIAHVYKNGLMRIFMDFWSGEPLKKWQRGVSWSWEEPGSGGQLWKALE